MSGWFRVNSAWLGFSLGFRRELSPRCGSAKETRSSNRDMSPTFNPQIVKNS